MPRRIVLFGASGTTGRLVAQELVAARARPVLAGRSYQNLAALGVQLGHGLEIAVADAENTQSVATMLRRGDVLVSTVGRFAKSGDAVVRGAIEAGATYLDCAAEPRFLARVFEHFDAPARDAGVALLPGLGFRYLAGSLAVEMALDGLGGATTVNVDYAIDRLRRGTDGGLEPLTLLRGHPGVATITVRAERDRSSTDAAAIATACTADRTTLRTVRVHGGDVHTATARMLAWCARRLVSHNLECTGALGPVDAFGLGALREICAVSGLGVDTV